MSSINITLFQLSVSRSTRSFRELVKFECSLHGHVTRQMGEFNLDKFLWVQWAMPVPTSGYWFWQHHTSSVNCLENTLKIYSPGYFANQNRSNALWPELFMDAQEIYLHHFLGAKIIYFYYFSHKYWIIFYKIYLLVINAQRCGNCWYKTNKTSTFWHTHTAVPFFTPAWWLQRPEKKSSISYKIKQKFNSILVNLYY